MNFKDYHKKLHEKSPTQIQNSIIFDENYPNYLKASAGTGKTEVLIQKIIHIIDTDQDVGLDNFAIITFTNKATDEMRSRLSERLYYHWLAHKKLAVDTGKIRDERFMRKQVEISNMLYISTIHEFCEKLLRKYGLYIGIPANFKIASIRKKVTDIINDIVNRYYQEEVLREIPQYKVVDLLDIFLGDNMNKGIIFDNESSKEFVFTSPDNEYWNQFKCLFIQMYLEVIKEIDNLKCADNILTIEDLIKKAADLMKNEYVLAKVSEKYKYVFIDEFQDTNKDQFNLVYTLMKNGVKVFLVGDDKQSIYAFRGSDIQSSIEMSSLISEIRITNRETFSESMMNENFRTDYQLLNKINQIFDHEFRFQGSRIQFPQTRLEKIGSPNDFPTPVKEPLQITFQSEITEVINFLVTNEKIGDRTISYSDIAILCRSNFDLDNLAVKLKAAEIPVEVMGGKGFYKSKEIVDTFKLFNGVINTSEIYKTELYFTDFYYAMVENTANLSFEGFLTELATVFREDTVEGILNFIYNETYIEEYYRSKGMYQAIANLQKLKDKARDLMTQEFMQPIQFLEYLNVMIMSNQEDDDADIAEIEKNDGVVSLYSIHKAKGLAFQVVIVPYFDKQLNRKTLNPKIIFHNKLNEPKLLAIGKEYFKDEVSSEDKDYDDLLESKTIELLEEELRILYVALTRPKHMLILMCDRPKEELMRHKRRNEFASWAKWVSEIDNGRFLDQHRWIPS